MSDSRPFGNYHELSGVERAKWIRQRALPGSMAGYMAIEMIARSHELNEDGDMEGQKLALAEALVWATLRQG